MFGRPPEEKAIEKGLNFQNKDNYEKAEEEFKKALKINPEYSDVYYYLGVLFKIQGKNTEAIESYKKALGVDPSNTRARYMLKLMTDKGAMSGPPPGAPKPPTRKTSTQVEPINRDKLKEDLKKNIKETHESGISFAKKEDFEEAIKQWQKSIKLNPNNYKAHYNLAVAYLRTGHRGKATTQLREAVKINPQYQTAKETLEKLAKKET